jgi:hypothetical protein
VAFQSASDAGTATCPRPDRDPARYLLSLSPDVIDARFAARVKGALRLASRVQSFVVVSALVFSISWDAW